MLLLVSSLVSAEQITLVWDDPNNDPNHNRAYRLYYWQSAWDNPASVDVDIQTTYTLSGLESGQTYTFAVTVHDGQGGRESAWSNQVSKTFAPVNKAPIAHDSTLNTSENTSLSGSLSASDADSDPLTYRLLTPSAPSDLTLAWEDPQNDPTQHPTYRLYYWQPSWEMPSYVDVSGQTTYTLQGLESGQSYHFAVTVHDGQGGRESTRSNEVSTTLEVPGPAAKGTVTLTDASTGAFTYTPLAHATGSDAFQFQVNDGELDSNIATVNITITPDTSATVASNELSNPDEEDLNNSNLNNSDNATTAALLNVLPIETGEVHVGHTWTYVSFQKTYIDPIVIATTLSYNDEDPAVVRIQNVDTIGFDIRVQEWDYL